MQYTLMGDAIFRQYHETKLIFSPYNLSKDIFKIRTYKKSHTHIRTNTFIGEEIVKNQL